MLPQFERRFCSLVHLPVTTECEAEMEVARCMRKLAIYILFDARTPMSGFYRFFD